RPARCARGGPAAFSLARRRRAALQGRDRLELGLGALELLAQALLLRAFGLEPAVEVRDAVLFFGVAAVAQRLILMAQRKPGVEVADHEVSKRPLRGKHGLRCGERLAEESTGAGRVACGMAWHRENEGIAEALPCRGVVEISGARRIDDLCLFGDAASAESVERLEVVCDELAIVGLRRGRRARAALESGPVVHVLATRDQGDGQQKGDDALRPHGRPPAAWQPAAGCAGARRDTRR